MIVVTSAFGDDHRHVIEMMVAQQFFEKLRFIGRCWWLAFDGGVTGFGYPAELLFPAPGHSPEAFDEFQFHIVQQAMLLFSPPQMVTRSSGVIVCAPGAR